MSKVYKSSHVSIGTPKPIVNIFMQETKTSVETEGKPPEVDLTSDPTEDAESIIEDAKQMYLKIIEEANAEAQAIIQAARAEAEYLTQSASENGYREGFENGYLDGRREAQTIVEEAAELREYLDRRKDEFYKEAEGQVVELVIDIAKKVIGDELKQNEAAILSLVNLALQKCAFKKKLVLKVSEEDSDFVSENKNRICKMVEGISDIEIVADLSLSQGSCIIETPSGEINSGVDVQMKEVEKIFAYLLRNE